MGTEENDNNFETVIIDGQLWAVTSEAGREISEQETLPAPDILSEQGEKAQDAAADSSDTDGAAEPDQEEGQAEEAQDARADSSDPADESRVAEPEQTAEAAEIAANQQVDTAVEPEFDPLHALTSLLVGGAIEGTSQLTARLKVYQEAIRQEAAEDSDSDGETAVVNEDELVRLRYAVVGLIFDAQATFRRNVSLWAKLADRSARVTNQVTQPVTNSFLFGPARRRYQKLVRRGEESLARWIAEGRIEEPPSRELASRTYNEMIDEFIDQLAENPQLQAVITEQSIGVASDMRDEVRERTVTADNLVEGLVRRILHRTPRAKLPEPPPEVQRWAGLSIEEYRAKTQVDETDEAKDKTS